MSLGGIPVKNGARRKKNTPSPRGRGSITRRGDNKYLVRVYRGTGADGTRRYSAKTVRGTISQAKQERTRMLRDIDRGAFVEPSKRTLQEYLNEWLDGKTDISARTLLDYRDRLTRYIYPALGRIRLDQVTTEKIQALYGSLQRDRSLSPRSIQYTHTALRQALRKAVALGLLVKNPTDHVTLPRKVRREMRALTPQQAAVCLETAKKDSLHALWSVLLHAGLRPNEALALKWSDLDGNLLRIQRARVEVKRGTFVSSEPKTPKSRRTVSLPDETVAALQAHKQRQAKTILKAGKKYDRQDYIFTTRTGTPLDRPFIYRRWRKLLKAAELPAVRLYDARHTHASLLLAAQVNPKIVSERLGHSSIVLTMDTYSHVMPELDAQATDAVQALLTKARQENVKEAQAAERATA